MEDVLDEISKRSPFLSVCLVVLSCHLTLRWATGHVKKCGYKLPFSPSSELMCLCEPTEAAGAELGSVCYGNSGKTG